MEMDEASVNLYGIERKRMYLMKMLNILVVEDDEVSILGIQRAFQEQNLPHKLSFFRNAEEALANLSHPSQNLPNLILLDLHMPGKGGIEFLRSLRANEQLAPIPVYIFTASQDDNDRTLAFSYNVAGYIRKPDLAQNYATTIAALNQYWNLIEFAS